MPDTNTFDRIVSESLHKIHLEISFYQSQLQMHVNDKINLSVLEKKIINIINDMNEEIKRYAKKN